MSNIFYGEKSRGLRALLAANALVIGSLLVGGVLGFSVKSGAAQPPAYELPSPAPHYDDVAPQFRHEEVGPSREIIITPEEVVVAGICAAPSKG
jgi:hypothetical protein